MKKPSPVQLMELARKHLAREPVTRQNEALRCIRRWPSAEARAWAAELHATANASAEIDAVIAIGSAVRAAGHAQSDVDFVLIHHGRKPKVLAAPPLDVDVRSFVRRDVSRELAAGHDWLGWAVRFGKVIFERDRFWSQLCAQWEGRLPLPSPDASLRRARRAEALARDLLVSGDDDAAAEQVVTMLTHLSRAHLLKARVYPASRPELPGQLHSIGEKGLADRLARALAGRRSIADLLGEQPRRSRSGRRSDRARR